MPLSLNTTSPVVGSKSEPFHFYDHSRGSLPMRAEGNVIHTPHASTNGPVWADARHIEEARRRPKAKNYVLFDREFTPIRYNGAADSRAGVTPSSVRQRSRYH